MPSSWPQPAVLKNLLLSPNTEGADKNDPGTSNGTSAPNGTHLYDYRVLALYKFVSPKLSKDYLPALKKELETACRQHSARGTLLIAEEGINGTICYPLRNQSDVSTRTMEASGSSPTPNDSRGDGEDRENPDGSRDALLAFLQAKFDGSLRIRASVADRPVFARLKIKIKTEIVTMHWQGDKLCGNAVKGTGGLLDGDENNNHKSVSSVSSSPPSCGPCCPTERVGEYVQPRDWNRLLMDPNTLVIDTRNEYEIDVGTFRNAINPHTQSFVEFPDWIKRNLVDDGNQNDADGKTAEIKNGLERKKKIAMFCEYKDFAIFIGVVYECATISQPVLFLD